MTEINFRPLHDVVIRGIEAEAKTKGGIIVPDTAKEKPQEGDVVAVRPTYAKGTITPLNVKAGDKILYGKLSAPTASPMAKTF